MTTQTSANLVQIISSLASAQGHHMMMSLELQRRHVPHVWHPAANTTAWNHYLEAQGETEQVVRSLIAMPELVHLSPGILRQRVTTVISNHGDWDLPAKVARIISGEL